SAAAGAASSTVARTSATYLPSPAKSLGRSSTTTRSCAENTRATRAGSIARAPRARPACTVRCAAVEPLPRLFDLPLAGVRDALASGAPVYVPVNPLEYHGPHLPLRNDAMVTAGLVRDVHARLAAAHSDWPLLVANDLDAGVEPVPGPG